MFFRALLYALLLGGVPFVAMARTDLGPKKNFFKIDAIAIEGVKKVEKESVLEKISSRPGMVLDNYLLRKDLRTIYQLKYFEQVSAYKEVRKGKNYLIFKVVEKPIVSRIVFKGNSEIKEDDLLTHIKTKLHNILDINTVKSDLVALAKQYEEKGFFLAKVSYGLKKITQDNVELSFHIREFDKVRVKKITFLGNKAFSDDELKSIMETREESLFSFMSGGGNFRELNFKTDVERIKYFYKIKGHLQINVGVPQITISEDRKWVFITISINEGPQFMVNDINFMGEVDFSEEEVLKELQIEKGTVYSEEALREDIQFLTEKYQDKGYAFANVLRTLHIVPGENKVDVEFSFEKGKIVSFGKIVIKGNTKTRDKVIRRELLIGEGMKFSGTLLRKSKENVNRLGFFEPNSVVFNTVSLKDKDDVINVEISVQEKNTGQISLGAGYSSTEKEFFQVNIAQNNFRGLGQILALDVNYSRHNKSYSFSFTEPYLFDTKWTLGGELFNTINSAGSSFDYRKRGIALRAGHPLADYMRLFLTYKYEVTKLGSVLDPTVNASIENGVGSSVKMTLIYDKRNHRFEPTKGAYFLLGSEYVGLGGDKKWWQNEVDGRYFLRVYKDLVFRYRFFASKLSKLDSREIPRSEKLSLGGARNLRGYGYEEIGPKKTVRFSDGSTRQFNERGLFATFTTFELEHPLASEAGLKWVLFFDAGSAGDYRHIKLYKDYGFGLRWFSPIGVLRFEFGYPIGEEGEGRGSQFHFDIGQLF